MAVCGEGTTTIHRDPKDVLELVLDVDQYRRADLKIGRVQWIRRDGNSGRVRHRGRFNGIPAPSVTLAFELTPYTRLDLQGEAVPWPLRGFEGFFTCEETASGTLVTHRECFTLGPVIGPVVKLMLGGWLSRDTRAEVVRLKQILEGSMPEARGTPGPIRPASSSRAKSRGAASEAGVASTSRPTA